MTDLATRPVTEANWADFVALFEARGGPHYCWCSVYRLPSRTSLTPDQKKRAMKASVRRSVPIGILAYAAEQPVGWCSIAPRESYAGLERSRKMPRVTSPETSTWTVLCFFVPRAYRHRGVASALLSGAIQYARTSGARVVEAYPFDTAGNTSTHRGHSSLFRAHGFRRDRQRWWLEVSPA
jgi:GNAT superfamily N-acetyltransferase